MEASLLTYRLTDFMKQIAANQMEQLVNKERMHNERLMSQDQISRRGKMSYNKSAYDLKMDKMAPIKNIVTPKKGNKENQPCNEEGKIRQHKKLGAVLGAAKNFKNVADKDADSMTKVNLVEKQVVVPTRSKFLKVAKIAVMISQVKQGRDICTCSSLDAKCLLHDS